MPFGQLSVNLPERTQTLSRQWKKYEEGVKAITGRQWDDMDSRMRAAGDTPWPLPRNVVVSDADRELKALEEMTRTGRHDAGRIDLSDSRLNFALTSIGRYLPHFSEKAQQAYMTGITRPTPGAGPEPPMPRPPTTKPPMVEAAAIPDVLLYGALAVGIFLLLGYVRK